MKSVAPLAGAWIETYALRARHNQAVVAPLAGAWIETRRGQEGDCQDTVAPLAGAWIETVSSSRDCSAVRCRTAGADYLALA